MGQIQNEEHNTEEERIFVDQFERIERECKRLKKVLPNGMVVMVMCQNDLNFFLERLKNSQAPFFFVLKEDDDGL